MMKEAQPSDSQSAIQYPETIGLILKEKSLQYRSEENR